MTDPKQDPTKGKADDLLDLLRACPPELIPAATESDTARDDFPPTTALGTPSARTWDPAWLETVDAAEKRIGRRICGARTIAGKPCELPSNHPNGRCRFHGGFDLTGAPSGNRYAYIHGLYSRRLRTCGAHCPQWAQCPCAGPDVDTVPLPERPTCPFEQEQYNLALADALDLAHSVARVDPFHVHIAHNVAILQVMLHRATVELRNRSTVTEIPAASTNQAASRQQVDPHLTAFTRIANELRKFLQLLAKSAPPDLTIQGCQQRLAQLRADQPGPDPHHFQQLPPDESQNREQQKKAESLARTAIATAIALAAKGQTQEALQHWNKANKQAPQLTKNWINRLRKKLQTQNRPTKSP